MILNACAFVHAYINRLSEMDRDLDSTHTSILVTCTPFLSSMLEKAIYFLLCRWTLEEL